MAKTFDSLSNTAETIRTNVLPDSNTAALVGQMLKDIIDKIHEVNTSSSGAVTDMACSPSADATSVVLAFTLTAGEKTVTRTVSLPLLSASSAGIMTPEQLTGFTQSVNTVSQNLITLSNKVDDNARSLKTMSSAIGDEKSQREKENKTLNDSIGTVASNLNDFSETKGKAKGLAPLDDYGLVPESFLPSGVFNVVMVDFWDADKQNVEGAYCFASADKSLTRCRLVNNTEEGGKYVWEPVALSTKVIYVDGFNRTFTNQKVHIKSV